MKSLEELRELIWEADRLWALAVNARRKAIAAEKVWRKALEEKSEQLALVDLRRTEE